jgi:AcrR family transcriptional regulator
LTLDASVITVLNMRSKRVINARDSETRTAIVRAAIQRFAKHGIEQTTLRQIVKDAGIGLGSVNFHFGSKLGLAHEILEDVASKACEARFREYDALEREAGDKPVPLDKIFRALFRPYVEGDEQQRLLLIYLIQQLRLAKLDLAREVGTKYFNGIARRTVALLHKAAPHLAEQDVWWRYVLALGSILSIVSDCGPENRLKRVSRGVANAADRAELTEQTIRFVVAGFEQAGPSRPRKRRPAKAKRRQSGSAGSDT